MQARPDNIFNIKKKGNVRLANVVLVVTSYSLNIDGVAGLFTVEGVDLLDTDHGGSTVTVDDLSHEGDMAAVGIRQNVFTDGS